MVPGTKLRFSPLPERIYWNYSVGTSSNFTREQVSPTALAPPRPTLQSVTIALDIVDVLTTVPELNLSELARRVGVAKSTAHRTCSVLVKRGLLDRTGGHRPDPVSR